MAAPVARQICGTANTAVGSVVFVSWTSATLSGSRLYLVVASDDNLSTVTDAESPSGWTLVSPPGKVTRTNNTPAQDKQSIRVYQMKNAGVKGAGTGVTVTFTTGATAASIYAALALIEVTGADLSAEADQVITSFGAATTIVVGPYAAPTTATQCLHIGLVTNSNITTLVDPGGGALNSFTLNSTQFNGGVASAAGANLAILTKADTASANESFTINTTGAVNRNYAAILLAVPAPSSSSGGGGGVNFFGMDDTNDGRVHRGCSLHYYSGTASLGNLSGTTLTATAQQLASMCDIIVGNVNLDNSGKIQTDRFAKMTTVMLQTKPNIILGRYSKSFAIAEGAPGTTFFPVNWYAHKTSWPNGPFLFTDGGKYPVAQPLTNSGQIPYTDPRRSGTPFTEYNTWRAYDGWWNISNYNTKYTQSLNMLYFDSMNDTFSTQIDPDTNNAYTRTEWNIDTRGIYTRSVAQAAGNPTWVNGLKNGNSYSTGGNPSSFLKTFCDGAVAENWIHTNYSDYTTFPSETDWKYSCDMHIDMNTSSKGTWGVVNIANDTAGNKPNVWVNPTQSQLEIWRRFTIATYMFAKRNRSWMEFVEKVSVAPWLEVHPYYNVDLGAPSDNWASAAAGKSSGLYIRKFARGVAVVNPTTAAAVFTYDRDYTDPGFGQPGPGRNNLTGVATSTLTMNPGDAMLLVSTSTGGTNAGAPTASFVAPVTSTSDDPFLVVVSASDPDGIAGVNLSYIDRGDGVTVHTVPMTLISGQWQLSIPLVSGTSTLTAAVTDANTSSPLSTTITTTITYTPIITGGGGGTTVVVQDTSVYDVVIGNGATTLGLMLYRAEDDTQPSRIYKSEPSDSDFAPIFIDRTNVTGDLGDNVQDFYMTFTQRDWSKGMGQRYYRQQTDRDSSFYDCRNVDVSEPGSVRLGAEQLTDKTPGGSQTAWMNGCYFKHPGIAPVSAPPLEGLLLLDNTGTSAKVVYRYSTDGGSTWTAQTTSGSSIWNDCVDLVVGDDATLYALECSGGTTSTIHRIGLPGTGTTLAWDDTTGVSGSVCHLITYFQGAPYVATRTAQLRKVTTLGSVAGQSTIHDFGGGRIVDLLSAPEGIYILYGGNQGDYRVFKYDGTNTTEVARLPSGWHYQIPHGSAMDMIGTAGAANSTHAMALVDGVLYVGGLIPAKDYVQAQRRTTAYRQALWFLIPGSSSGLIWESQTLNRDWRRGSGGAIVQVRGDNLIWYDGTDERVMRYDPASGGVSCIGTWTLNTPTLQHADQTVNGTINSLATNLVVASGGSNNFMPGTVLMSAGSTEKALVTTRISATSYQLIRGYQDTTPSDSTFTNGATLIVDPPMPAPHRLAYDPSNDRIMIVWYPSGPAGWSASTSTWGNRLGFIDLQRGPAYNANDVGLVVSSAFDFNSSLEKYYRSVSIDGEVTQFPRRSDETPGTFDLYYILDDVSPSTANATLIKQNAQPGTFYDINVTGRSLSLFVQLNPGAATPAQPISQGPILTRVSVKGVPIMPGYRKRLYQVALFAGQANKAGEIDPNPPLDLYEALCAFIQTNTPVTVSDSTMDSVSMVFTPENCKLREIRPLEWIAYVELREV